MFDGVLTHTAWNLVHLIWSTVLFLKVFAAIDSTTLEMLHSYSCNKITMTVRNRENNAFPIWMLTNVNILK